VNQTVIQYVLGRLKDLGVGHAFGVPGDFVYDVCDGIEDDPGVQWIGCANELNAAYAADGYARTKGVGLVVTTYGAGEMCTFGGMAGAHAENAKVVSIAGMPGLAEQAAGHRTHHMIADQPPRSDLFVNMIKPFTAGDDSASMLTPENCVYEVERLIAAMLYHSKPIYMGIPRGVAHAPVVMPEGDLDIPLANPTSNADAVDQAVREILNNVENAKQACFMPGYLTLRYGCVDQAQALIEASGLLFFTGFQDVGVLSQQHPQFGGTYLGKFQKYEPAVTDYVEGCDCIIGIGPENHEFNNGFHSMNYDFKETINIMPHSTRVGMSTYDNVEMADVLTALTARISKSSTPPKIEITTGLGEPSGEPGDKITYEPLYERLRAFVKPNDIFVIDTAMTALSFMPRLTDLPDGVSIEGQSSWGAIGWGTAEILGNCLADPSRRSIILAGEGGHQMTANELGTFARYGAKPVFLVANNHGFFGERVTNRYPDESYNDLAEWDFSAVPAAMGCNDWLLERVTTLGELDEALAKASTADTGVYIDIDIPPYECPDGAADFYTLTGAFFGMEGRKWEDWLKEMAAKQK